MDNKQGVQDITAPVVVMVMVMPKDGATGIGLATPVVLMTFSIPLDFKTVNSANFQLHTNGMMISLSVTLSSDKRTVTLIASLAASSIVTAVATSRVKDLLENFLVDFNSTFSTASISDPD